MVLKFKEIPSHLGCEAVSGRTECVELYADTTGRMLRIDRYPAAGKLVLLHP
jgi:hypothetical protein